MKLLVICGAGMTSSMMVSKMRAYVQQKENLDYKIGSCAVSQISQYAPQADVIFIAPHLDYLYEELKEKYPDQLIIEISTEIYGALDGQAAVGLIEKKNEKQKDLVRWKKMLYFFSRRRFLKAMTQASYTLMMVLIIGGIFTILKNFPLRIYLDWIEGTAFQQVLILGEQMTTNAIAVYMAFLTGYYYGQEYGVSGAHAGINSLICFFLLLNVHGSYVDLTYFNSRGLFCALITAFVSVRIYCALSGICERFTATLKQVPHRIYMSFFSLIPLFASVCFFTLITAAFQYMPYGSFPSFVYTMLQERLTAVVGGSVYSAVIMMILVNILWFFGIHGGNLVGSVTRPILMPLSLENVAAFSAGEALPHIVHSHFTYAYTFGGAGSTLSLAFLMCTRAKSEHLKQLGRISLPMGIFFINEPIIMGLPIMMNPLMLIPFIGVPLVSMTLTYFVMASGIVPHMIGFDIPWTTPPLINGLIQGGWKLALWQFILLIMQGILWYPFFRIMDQKYLSEESVQNNATDNGIE